jgi:hypothetical protein
MGIEELILDMARKEGFLHYPEAEIFIPYNDYCFVNGI